MRFELMTSSLPRKRSTPGLMLYQLSYFRISSFLKGIFFVELPSSVGHYRKVTPSFFVRSPQICSFINSGSLFLSGDFGA